KQVFITKSDKFRKQIRKVKNTKDKPPKIFFSNNTKSRKKAVDLRHYKVATYYATFTNCYIYTYQFDSACLKPNTGSR
ncbi:hypothetical protein, partial [Bacteroides cellulosilyticus]|uniref:hypothetical protein n=1 Tax=Bacteroides cellulosilyticus TaxID=246787 RepID=UPI0032ECD1CF